MEVISLAFAFNKEVAQQVGVYYSVQYGQLNFETSPNTKYTWDLSQNSNCRTVYVGIKIEELYAAVIGKKGRSSAAAAATDSGRHAAFVHIRLKLFLGMVKIL